MRSLTYPVMLTEKCGVCDGTTEALVVSGSRVYVDPAHEALAKWRTEHRCAPSPKPGPTPTVSPRIPLARRRA